MIVMKMLAAQPNSGSSLLSTPDKLEDISRPRVLVVDDVPEVLRAIERVLGDCGYEVDCTTDGDFAAEMVKSKRYDAILSDITMPGITGLQLLQMVRDHDPELPVILMTGDPSVDTALPAIEHGVLSYLVKPVTPDVLRKKVSRAVQLHRLSQMKREAFRLLTESSRSDAERKEMNAVFDSALSNLYMVYQPIVRWSDRSIHGYEALVRSGDSRLPNPHALFKAAERLDRAQEMNRLIRQLAPHPFVEDTGRGYLYFNLHVQDLSDDRLIDPDSPLVCIANRVVLEITERASLDQVSGIRTRIAQLRDLGFRIAIDDLGAGYAGLSSFACLEPDVVKLDMALIRDVHKAPTKQRLVRSMTQLCSDMGLEVVAEGVETAEERDVLIDLGCELLQGYYFAKPDLPFVDPRLP